MATVGKVDPWPPGVWTDHPGLTLRPSTNANQLEVTVAPDAAPGVAWVRLFNADGASEPRLLRVSTGREIDEIEPNDRLDEAQPVALPAAVSGRLGKSGDVDTYTVDIQPGGTLVAALEAYTLMSPVDAVLRLVDSHDVPVTWNHDDGRSLDPLLHWTSTNGGTYRVQVFGFPHPAGSDVRFTGNDRCVYRLRLTTGPWARRTVPLGIPPGGAATLTVHGWNRAPGTVTVGHVHGDPVTGLAEVPLEGWENTLELPVGDGAERAEAPPGEDPPSLPVPGAVTGMLGTDGGIDRLRFEARKDTPLVLRVDAARLGFPLDAWLAVESEDGKELVRNDDADGEDPRIEWTPPSDGTYRLAVGSLRHRAGADQHYRVSVAPLRPAVVARLADAGHSVGPGSTNEWKLTVTRTGGHTAPLEVSVEGLPTGVSAAPVSVPDKGGELALRVIAAADAPPFSGPVRVLLRTGPDDPGTAVPHRLTTTGVNNGVPQGFARLARERLEHIWLTVPAPPPPPAAVPDAAP